MLDDLISTVIGLPSLESKDRAAQARRAFLLGIPSALQAASSLPPRKDLLRLLLAVVLLLAGHFQEARPRVERDQDRVRRLRRGCTIGPTPRLQMMSWKFPTTHRERHLRARRRGMVELRIATGAAIAKEVFREMASILCRASRVKRD